MILKVIFAVCFLMQSTSMTPLQSSNKFRRQAECLLKTLNETCNMLKNTTCRDQKIRTVKLDFKVDLGNEELCASSQNVFCQVDKTLKVLDHEICKNDTSLLIQELKFLKRPDKCSLSDNLTTMKEFCPKLKDYVQRLYNRC